jgi:hypothetical protein
MKGAIVGGGDGGGGDVVADGGATAAAAAVGGSSFGGGGGADAAAAAGGGAGGANVAIVAGVTPEALPTEALVTGLVANEGPPPSWSSPIRLGVFDRFLGSAVCSEAAGASELWVLCTSKARNPRASTLTMMLITMICASGTRQRREGIVVDRRLVRSFGLSHRRT